MRTRLTNTLQRLSRVAGLTLLLTPALARGDGSIFFNGPTEGTSKLENTLADVLDGASDMTICVWVYPEGLGESSDGFVATFDETGTTGVRLQKGGSATSLAFTALFGATAGFWSFPVAEDDWSAVAVTYNKSLTSNNPAARVNFSSATVTQVGPDPTGAAPTINSGYCIGARSNQDNTWEGRIAHVQVFNRILSADEMDACLRAPGSVTNGLRLWLPMTNGIDIHDRSGNSFHATASDILTGSDGPLLSSPLGAPPRGVARVDSGYNSVNQFVIPRHGDGTSHPALQVKGSGPASVIQGTTYGPVEGTPDPQEIVVTEDYVTPMQGMDYWTNGSQPIDAVLQPEIRDCTIAGKDDVGSYTSGGLVNDNPGFWNPATGHPVLDDHPDLETGLYLRSSAPLVENVRFFHIAGTCCIAVQPEGLGSRNGAYQPFDREKPTFRNLWFLRAYAGLEIAQIDSVVGNITCRALRDFGVKFSAGSIQIDGPMHLYGVSSSPATTAADPSPAAWFNTTVADRCWGGPWYVETSDIGMKINSNVNVLGPIYSHSCPYGNILVEGSYNTVRDFEVTPNDILATGNPNSVNGTAFQLALSSAFLDDLLNGMRIEIVEGQGAGQWRSITNYVGSTDTATLDSAFSPAPNGSSVYAIHTALPRILISAQENTVINGRIGPGGAVPDGTVAIRIDGSNAGLRQVIRDVIIFGTTNSSAPLISVEETLDDSIIVAKCFNAGTFLDLNTSSMIIGKGNYIRLTTAGTVTKAVNLPASWDKSNRITVDGLKLRGSITNVSDDTTAVITSSGHGLSDGDKIAIDGVLGETGVNSAASSTHTVDVTGSDTFTVPVNTDGGSIYVSGSGWWGDWEAK